MYDGISDLNRSWPAVSLRTRREFDDVRAKKVEGKLGGRDARATTARHDLAKTREDLCRALHQGAGITYHNCKRTVLSSKYIVFDRKSMPIVALWVFRARKGGRRSVSADLVGLAEGGGEGVARASPRSPVGRSGFGIPPLGSLPLPGTCCRTCHT